MKTNGKPLTGVVLVLDIGGTWIKGAVGSGQLLPTLSSIDVHRWPNPVGKVRSAQEYAETIVSCCLTLAESLPILRVVAATAGEVAPSGRSYRIAAAHLAVMANTEWLELVEKRLGCPLTLVNDAEAFLLGASVGGHLPVRGNVAGLVVGTGLGFSLLRDGRWWKPARRLSFLGSILIPEGEYDAWASAVGVSQICGADIASLLSRSELAEERNKYLDGLSRIIASATALFFLDKVVLGGGLCEAATSVNFPLAAELQARLEPLLLPGLAEPSIELAEAGNMEVLRGAMALASGLATADGLTFAGAFEELSTEGADVSLRIEEQPPREIARLLAQAESDAAVDFLETAPLLGEEAMLLSSKLNAGGRVVYVGAGTSGRIGAIDAVEIPCTFGLARERFVAVIAGGISDAALSVEGDSEEDSSAVPDLIPLQLGSDDFVVGISASGTAFFVRSALAYARALGAHTLMLHEARIDGPDFFDTAIRLRSGCELIRGSTRMKAGTATKKALNILSTTAMVLMGKVKCGYMIDLECSNRKLAERAARILADLEKIRLEEAIQRLAENMGSLPRALSGAASCCRAGMEKPLLENANTANLEGSQHATK